MVNKKSSNQKGKKSKLEEESIVQKQKKKLQIVFCTRMENWRDEKYMYVNIIYKSLQYTVNI